VLGIGWLILAIVTAIICYKIFRRSHNKPICPVCGGIVKKPAIHDKSTGEYYHPEHWLEYTKQEILNELRNSYNSPRW